MKVIVLAVTISTTDFIWSHGLNASFNLICQKPMLYMRASCTIYMPDGWVMGQWWTVF
jgi:hypothetical protein